MRPSIRVYPSTTDLPSALSSAFAAGAVGEPVAEGGVGIVPGIFFTFLGGADMVRCGVRDANNAALFGVPKNALPGKVQQSNHEVAGIYE